MGFQGGYRDIFFEGVPAGLRRFQKQSMEFQGIKKFKRSSRGFIGVPGSFRAVIEVLMNRRGFPRVFHAFQRRSSGFQRRFSRL